LVGCVPSYGNTVEFELCIKKFKGINCFKFKLLKIALVSRATKDIHENFSNRSAQKDDN